MNLKELGELRRRIRPEKNGISEIYGCYVNANKEIVSDMVLPVGLLTEEETEKYMALLRKTLSGGLGKNLIDIVFSTRQVADSDEHRLLTALRASGLKDGAARKKFYDTVIQSLDMGEDNYLILLAYDRYDVPYHGKDGSRQADASDTVFPYILCTICRC